MDVRHFDALAKTVGDGTSRRRVLHTLLLGAGSGVVTRLVPARSVALPTCAFVLCEPGKLCCEGTVGPNPICYDPDHSLCCRCAGGVTYTPGSGWKTCRDWCRHLG